MAELGCFYVRYMDDWVILTPTRWKLRRAIRAVNQVMNQLQVEKHPDKTFIGRIARGFDFLGYFFSGEGLGIGKNTIARMRDKVSLLYEQGADELRVEKYVRRWWLWVKGGVDGLLSTGTIDLCCWEKICLEWLYFFIHIRASCFIILSFSSSCSFSSFLVDGSNRWLATYTPK